jgi:general secretion pathway protein K
MKIRSLQSGMALISAVLVAALVASVAIVLAARSHQWLNQLQNRQNFVVAQTIAYSAVDLARFTIRDDMRNNSVDHRKEPWNLPIPEIKIEEGVASGQLEELQGRFNLGAMVSAGQLDQDVVDGFSRLCSAIGISSGLAQTLASAVKKDLEAKRQAGAIATFPYVLLSDLGKVEDFDVDTLQKIEPYVTILPEKMPVNVNFATAEVLQASMDGMSSSDAAAVISARGSKHFAHYNDFVAALPENLRGKANSSNYTVQSLYFSILAKTAYGRVHVRYQALLKRSDGQTMPVIVWAYRRFGGV